jgi:hypothetical protein
MSKRNIILLSLFIAIALIIYVSLPSDKAEIKKVIKKGKNSIEKEDIDSVMACVSLNYRDDYGFTYLYLKDGFKKFFELYSDIEVGYKNLKINIDKDKKEAKAVLDVWVLVSSGDNRGYILGSITDPVHITLRLIKERFKWRVKRTEGLPLENYP